MLTKSEIEDTIRHLRKRSDAFNYYKEGFSYDVRDERVDYLVIGFLEDFLKLDKENNNE